MYGGQTALAGLLGIRQSAVAYWVKNNKIPGKWHQEMLSIAQKKGIDISAVDLLAVDLADKSSGTPLINEQSGQPGQYHVAPSASLHEGAEQFLFYASEDGNIKVQVFVRDETVWASQKGMAEIFDVDVRTINEHLQNIFKTRELDESAVIRNYRITADDGKNYNTKFYSLDAIISVGYRVSSYKATQFRRWATSVLREYLIKGFTLDDERLKQGSTLFGKDYFDELLERIREIRASERRFYQRVTDIYRECSIDYDPESPITKEFYAHIQDKLHYAIHGHTAADLKMIRADATKPKMGLTSYKNEKTGGKITKLDVTIGKNYLTEEEIRELERLVSMYLDWAEGFARRRIPMTMKDWAQRLDGFLSFNEYQILNDYGKKRRELADRHALAEFEKYRIIQDREFLSDFDKLADEIKTRGRLPKKKA